MTGLKIDFSSPLFPVFRLSRENSQPENIYDIIFEKTKGVYAEGVFFKGFFKKGLIRNFAEFTSKHVLESLFFDKVKLYRSAAAFKRRL